MTNSQAKFKIIQISTSYFLQAFLSDFIHLLHVYALLEII